MSFIRALACHCTSQVDTIVDSSLLYPVAYTEKELIFERENLPADSRTGTLLAARHTLEGADREREGAE